MIESSMTKRAAMAEMDRQLPRQGVPPEIAGPRAYRNFSTCDCTFADGNPVKPSWVRVGAKP
jgi:hypothetical protein